MTTYSDTDAATMPDEPVAVPHPAEMLASNGRTTDSTVRMYNPQNPVNQWIKCDREDMTVIER